jgi:hypothetical protein
LSADALLSKALNSGSSSRSDGLLKRTSTALNPAVEPPKAKRRLEASFGDREKDIMDVSQQLIDAKARIAVLEEEVKAERRLRQEAEAKLAEARAVSADLRAENFQTSPKVFPILAGVQDFETLQGLSEVYCGPGGGLTEREKAARDGDRSRGMVGRSVMLNPLNRLFLTLIFLRQGLSMAALAVLFGVSESTVGTVIHTVLPRLSKFFNHIFPAPTKESILRNYPAEWKEALGGCLVAMIIDGAEFFLQVSSNPVVQSITYSHYKHHCTGKFLIAITPDGYIAFVSKVFGGHISDTELVIHSGFLNLLGERGMNILADKGFTALCLELLKCGAFLFAPGRLGERKQFYEEEVHKNALFAKYRIHIERAIALMKNFQIITKAMPVSIWHMVDDILGAIRGLCCLMTPLTSKTKE